MNTQQTAWDTRRAEQRRAYVRWLWDAFHHHARLFTERLNNLRFPEELVRRSHADATEFLEQLREEEPLARLLHWPAFDEPDAAVGDASLPAPGFRAAVRARETGETPQ